MRILLVDDHILFREGLMALLNSQNDLQVVAEAGSVHDAIQIAQRVEPDLVLMDFSLPDGDGTDAARVILADCPSTMIVFLTIHDAPDLLYKAIRSGARGYLVKNLPVNKLLASIRALEHGEAAISRTMTSMILEEFARLRPPEEPAQAALADLTMRELDILRELGMDASNQEIATRLSISESTVKNHIHSLLVKLNQHNRRDLARFARQQGLVKLSWRG
jgi:two-component system NarL family response regulator